jgi:hypothetical protein
MIYWDKKYGAAVPLVMSRAAGKPFGRKCNLKLFC